MQAPTEIHVLSVNVGQPREIMRHGKTAISSIFKQPVEGRVAVRRLNIEGDRQSDLRVHGGVDKAVYAYPYENYAYWRGQFPDKALPPGMFGENLTLEGLLEEDVHIGDRLQIGSAQLEVSEPRFPCYKLDIRFERDDMIKRMLASGLSGFYMRVLQEGDVAAGDAATFLHRDPTHFSIAEFVDLYRDEKYNRAQLKRVIAIEALPDTWREHFLERLSKLARGDK